MLFRIPHRLSFRHEPAAAVAAALKSYSTVIMSKTDHAQRTAAEPRNPSLHKVTLARVEDINPAIRTFRLDIPAPTSGIKFLAGQWLDVYVPGIDKPGGFTITSPPSKAFLQFTNNTTTTATDQHSSSASSADAAAADPLLRPYLELAVQKSPDNVVAQWLWQPTPLILSSELRVRIGGSFVWPPPSIVPTTLRKIVFVAGGIGINPLISILDHLAEKPLPPSTRIHFLYSTRDHPPGHGQQRYPRQILFLERLARLFGGGGGDGKQGGGVRGELKLFLTPGGGGGGVSGQHQEGQLDGVSLPFLRRRMTVDDIAGVIGADKRASVVYLCGLPTMTDEFVGKLTSTDGLGLEQHRVLYEKWW